MHAWLHEGLKQTLNFCLCSSESLSTGRLLFDLPKMLENEGFFPCRASRLGLQSHTLHRGVLAVPFPLNPRALEHGKPVLSAQAP